MRFFLLLLFSVAFVPVFSQVTEDFTDGEFLTNPTWSGDATEWEVINTELHLNNPFAAGSLNRSYLSTPSTSLVNATWEFFVRITENPSGTNYVDMYLASDIADLEGAVNGYYVRIGGTNDEVSLYSTASTTTPIINGADDILDVSSSEVHVRVTRDAAGLWELFSDTTGTGLSLNSEGTATDVTFTTSSFFGIHTRYTSTRNMWCFLDSITVSSQPVIDTTPPVLLSAVPISDSELLLDFDEFLDVSTASNTLNYGLNTAITNPTTATIEAGDSSQVRLVFFAGAFPQCTPQNIDVILVEDRSGNQIVQGSQTFTYAQAGTAAFKDVIINEIFADPTPQIGLPAVEMVELYNRSNTVVDLNGWAFADGGGTVIITLSSYLLCPGEYVILVDDTATWNAYSPAIEMNLPSLTNGGERLGLLDNNAIDVDSVTYDLSWYGGAPWEDGGYSLELINPTDLCALGGSNWTHSTHPDGGTPAQPNSVLSLIPDTQAPNLVTVIVSGPFSVQVCFDESLDLTSGNTASNYTANNGLGNPATANVFGSNLNCVELTFATQIDTNVIYTLTTTGIEDCKGNSQIQTGNFIIPGPTTYRSVRINEIFADPDTNISPGLPGEYIELFNVGIDPVDLLDWKFADNGTQISLPSYILQANSYVTICKTEFVAVYGASRPVLGVTSLPGLNNTSDELGLQDAFSTLIDSVEYDISWYQDPDKDDGGWSLELINPENDCANLNTWIASNDPSGGTFGLQNSVYNNTPDIQAPNLVSILIQGANSIEVCFDETMDQATLATLANYSIDNGQGNPSSATPQGGAGNCVVLGLTVPIDTGTTYTVSFSNILDCSGNSVGLLQGSFVLGGPASPGQIVINEIMADPAPVVGLPEDVEFIELYNSGTTVVDLTGWIFTDASTTNAVLPAFNLQPGGYLIVCDDSDVPSLAAFGDVVGASSFPGLTNAGERLQLFDAGSNLMDQVDYDISMYGDEVKEDGGWTLERIDPTFSCDNLGNWRASENAVLGGTPGQPNSVLGTFADNEAPQLTGVLLLTNSSIQLEFNEPLDPASVTDPGQYTISEGIGNPLLAVAVAGNLNAVELLIAGTFTENIVYCVTVTGVTDCPGNAIGGNNNTACFGIPVAAEAGDVVINEILFNPYTGGSDFVELYNTSGKIIDLSTMFIAEIDPDTDGIDNEKLISSTQLLLLPESYICLTADRTSQIENYQPIDPSAIFEMASFPSYGNDGECVIYVDTLEILDRLAYSDDWHFSNLDDDDGVSLERHDFFRPTQDEDNWHSAASTVSYATPGYRNSQVLVADAGNEEVWLDFETFSPDQDGFEDVLAINYLFPTSGWNTRVNIFDNKGRLVRNLMDNTLLGTEGGTFTWDGTNDNDNKVDVGVYVILVETSNPNTGEVKNFKLGCVVAARFN